MKRDPKITMDTVRLAVRLLGPAPTICVTDLGRGICDAAELQRIARRIQRLNEDDCNLGSGDPKRDSARDQLVRKANELARFYGATFHPYGEGSGLWPHMRLSDGTTATP